MEIYKLVERRREVKKLIKEKKNLSDEQLVQVSRSVYRETLVLINLPVRYSTKSLQINRQ